MPTATCPAIYKCFVPPHVHRHVDGHHSDQLQVYSRTELKMCVQSSASVRSLDPNDNCFELGVRIFGLSAYNHQESRKFYMSPFHLQPIDGRLSAFIHLVPPRTRDRPSDPFFDMLTFSSSPTSFTSLPLPYLRDGSQPQCRPHPAPTPHIHPKPK